MIISTHIIPLFPYLRYNKVVIDVNLDVKTKKSLGLLRGISHKCFIYAITADEGDLSRDGKRLLIASAYNDPQSGDFLTEIMICDPLTGEEIVNTALYDTMPLKAQFSKTGFYLLTDKYLLFCDNSAVTRSRYDFEFNYPTHVTMTSDALFAAFSESVLGDTQKVLIFSDKGNEMGQYIADGKIVRLIHDSNDVYTLTDSNIQRYDIASGRSIKYKVDSNIVDMILARSDTLYLCYLSHANAIVTNDALSFDKNENDIVNAK